jgi:hypothetical protein
MADKRFYIVMMTHKPVLLATLDYDGQFYIYKPYNPDECRIPRITNAFKSGPFYYFYKNLQI